ncbi:MAG TPA: ABC transporter permease [Puia sp.]|nr:ABC transporter permease [Puia sp.]
MIKNYFRIALRSMQKQKVFTFINVFGLSVGIACVALLVLFAVNEFSFDHFHKNAHDVYRYYNKSNFTNVGPESLLNTDYSGPSSASIGEAMKKDLPDVSDFVRVQLPWGDNLIRTDQNAFRAPVTYADPSFFSVFTFPLKYGNTATALRDMNDVVLTASKAKEFFGTDDVIGRTVQISIGATFQPFRVTGVAEDIPSNSTIRFDVLGNYRFALANHGQFFIGGNWHPIASETFLLLRPGSSLAGDNRQLDRFMLSFDPNIIASAKNAGLDWKGHELPMSFKLQPLLSIHTDAWFHAWGFADFGVIDPTTIWILLAIAAGILLIACINFTTLAIGRSAKRSKEVGVRKVLGGQKKQIIFQFLTESVLLAVISGLLGLMLASSLLPLFNQLSGKELNISILLSPKMAILLIALILIAGLLAGSYPALVLSNFKPLEVLKNKIRVGGANVFTKSLVTFQFVVSIMLIVSTIIILEQAKYMVDKDPGFNKENVIAVDASETDPNRIFSVFKQSLSNQSFILGVGSASVGLGAGNNLLGYSDKGLSADINIIDSNYLRVLGMQLVAGRNFAAGDRNDTIESLIINETMMRAFGWNAGNAVGKEIKGFQGNTALIVGVVKNFNYRPLSEAVKNQAFVTNGDKDKGYPHFYVRIAAGNPSPAIAAMQKAWGIAMPGIPLKYSFLDEDVNRFYQAEERWSSIVAWAGGISIFLACLGLLGLASLAAVNRTKEIGVRKVLGATIPNIVMLLSKDFIKLILIAFFIASPLAWYIMNKWLQDYVSRISISWVIFFFVGVFAVLSALTTIGFHAIKAAMTNPVKSLRTD